MKKICLIMCMVLLITSLAGCSFGKTAKDDVPTVKWYMLVGKVTKSNDSVIAEVQKRVREKLDVNLEIVPLDIGNYDSKLQVLNASAEKFDIMFTSNWLNNYHQNVSKNVLLPLDDMLKTVTPDLYESIPDYWWDGAKVDGKIYGIPNQQIATRGPSFLIPEQNIKSLGLEVPGIDNEITDYNEALDYLEDYFKKVKDATGTYTDMGAIWTGGTNMFGLEEVSGSSIPGAIRYKETGDIKIVNQYDTEEFRNYIERRRQWVEDGLVTPQIDEERTLGVYIGEGKVYPKVFVNPVYKPGLDAEMSANSDVDLSVYVRTGQLMSSGGLAATLNGISRTSENPELALKVLELFNKDAELYNLLSFGIEGVNYTREGNKIRRSKENMYDAYNWAIGSVYQSEILADQDDDIWEQTEAINNAASRSPLIGFSPNLDGLKTQIASCSAVLNEYLEILDCGAMDPDKIYPEFMSKLKIAGCDEIVAEIQRQVDEWIDSK